MIEMLGVLAIIGVLSVGGLAGYSKMMSQYRINASMEQMAMISSKISAYGSGANSYEGLNLKSAYKLGAPISDPESATNPFNGGIEVEPSNIEGNSEDKQAYVITFTGLTEEACVALASSSWGNVRNSSFIGLGGGAADKEKNIKDALYLGCFGDTDSKTYAAACQCKEDDSRCKVPIPMDVGTAALGCTCPTSDCVFMMKFF